MRSLKKKKKKKLLLLPSAFRKHRIVYGRIKPLLYHIDSQFLSGNYAHVDANFEPLSLLYNICNLWIDHLVKFTHFSPQGKKWKELLQKLIIL